MWLNLEIVLIVLISVHDKVECVNVVVGVAVVLL